MDWRVWIGELVLIKQALFDADRGRVWEYRLPGPAASEDVLSRVEDKLGEKLDPKYRAFLLTAGGWPAFIQAVDLFGPEDLMGGARAKRAEEYLGYVEDGVIDEIGVQREELLPIAVSQDDKDLFVMTRRSADRPGMIIWLAGEEIDRFEDFEEFFLSMKEYNKRELDKAEVRRRGQA